MKVKYTVAEVCACIKEFRQYGYDPYNSDGAAEVWFRVRELLF